MKLGRRVVATRRARARNAINLARVSNCVAQRPRIVAFSIVTICTRDDLKRSCG
jgi:hypothetical protein